MIEQELVLSQITMKRWWKIVKGRNVTLEYKTIKSLHAKLIRSDSVTQKKGADQLKTIITEINLDNFS